MKMELQLNVTDFVLAAQDIGEEGVFELIKSRAEKLHRDATDTAISRATKHMHEAWQRKNRFPICPHCKEAIMPEDVANGVSTVSKDSAMQRRAARAYMADRLDH